jgi:hypothetical protein
VKMRRRSGRIEGKNCEGDRRLFMRHIEGWVIVTCYGKTCEKSVGVEYTIDQR